MEVTEVAIEIEEREVQDEKALPLMVFTEVGMETEESDVQKEKE